MEILSFQQAQITVIEQAILAEIDALLKAETSLLNDAAEVEFVTVGIDQKIPAPDIFVRKLGDVVIGSVRNSPKFAVPFQVDTFDAQDKETRLLFQQWQALLQEVLFQAVVAIQKSDILSAGKIQPVISGSRDSGVIPVRDPKVFLPALVPFQDLRRRVESFFIPQQLPASGASARQIRAASCEAS